MNEQANNFLYFVPKQTFTRVSVRVQDTEAWTERFKSEGLNTWSSTERVKFRLTFAEAEQKRDLLLELFQASYGEWRFQEYRGASEQPGTLRCSGRLR